MNRRNILSLSYLLAGLLTLAVCNLGIDRHSVPPVPLSELGLALDHSEQAQPIAAQMPTFFVVGADGEDNTRKNIRLWDWVKVANGGQHTPNYAQQTGDCVSFGAKNACEYFLGAAIGKGILDSEFHPIYPPYIYGGSRVIVGKSRLGRSAGSVGAWAAEWVAKQGGVLRSDIPDVPQYSGRIADEWGYKGPPKDLIEAAKLFTFATVAPVKSAKDVRDAICNGYPVTIASDFGTNTIKPVDNRRVGIRNTKWYHQMCIVAYDGSSAKPWYYVLNSWGENAHPAPLQGEPPGGFWIGESDVEYIVRQGDSFAYSGFDGFPAQEFIPDFTVIGAAGPSPVVPVTEDPAMFPLSPDVQMPGTILGVALLIAALIAFLRGNGVGRLGVAALAAAMLLPLNLNAQDTAPVDFGTLVTSASRTEMRPVRSDGPIEPLFASLVSAAETPPPIEFAILTQSAQETPRPAVKASVIAMQRLMKNVEVAHDADVCPCGCGLPGCTCAMAAKAVQVAVGPTFEQWKRTPGTQGYYWHSTRQFGETPEPGTFYQNVGVLVPINAVAKSSPLKPATHQPAVPVKPGGHFEPRRICRGGVCTIEQVWVE